MFRFGKRQLHAVYQSMALWKLPTINSMSFYPPQIRRKSLFAADRARFREPLISRRSLILLVF
jgi:hypothetical protein